MRSHLTKMMEWRTLEIAEMKALLPRQSDMGFELFCRGAMVLCYAHWEGAFNDCLKVVVGTLKSGDIDLSRAHPGISALFFSRDIDSFLNRRIEEDTVVEHLIAFHFLCQKSVKGEVANARAATTRSNLNWNRIEVVFSIFGFSWPKLHLKKIFIEHKLSRLRHSIAHGEAPRLTRVVALQQLDETSILLDEIAEYFHAVYSSILLPLSDQPKVNNLTVLLPAKSATESTPYTSP